MTQAAPALAGPEQPLTAATTPANDEVLAIFRNGAVIDIVAPGRRARPLWYRPRPGALTFARILRSDIVLEADVHDVTLTDHFRLPVVTITCRVALNPANEYANLRERLLRRGLRFSEALADESYASLDSLVRTLFSGRTHEAVSMDPRPAGIGTGQEVLGGLFVVDAVEQLKVTGDPQFEEMRVAKAGATVDQHVIDREGVAQRRRDEYAEQEAQRRSVPLFVMEHPELVLAREQHAADSLRLEAEVRQVEIRAQADVAMEQIRNVTALGRASAAGGLPFIAPAILSSTSHSSTSHSSTSHSSTSHSSTSHSGFADDAPHETEGGATYHPAPVHDLARDSALQRRWKATVGAHTGLIGAVRVQEGNAELVVLVLDPTWWSDLPALEHSLADAYPGVATAAIPAAPDLASWVVALTRARVPDIDALAPTYSVQERDDQLIVQLGSGNGSALRVVQAVNGPATLILPALRDLLPYADVTCVPGH